MLHNSLRLLLGLIKPARFNILNFVHCKYYINILFSCAMNQNTVFIVSSVIITWKCCSHVLQGHHSMSNQQQNRCFRFKWWNRNQILIVSVEKVVLNLFMCGFWHAAFERYFKLSKNDEWNNIELLITSILINIIIWLVDDSFRISWTGLSYNM